MRVVDDAWHVAGLPRGAIVTIGNFDALHRGHRALIDKVVERSRALDTDAAVITFEPHPVQVLHPDAGLRRLTTRRQKLAMLAELGVDAVLLVHFDRQLAAVEAKVFAEDFLGQRLAVREIHVGRRFTFGRGRTGDLTLLQEAGGRQDFRAFGIDEVSDGGEAVSSTRIRRAVEAGEVELAARLLGRPYPVEGEVARGDGRGRQLGWPTANLELASELTPARGVYAAEAILSGGRRRPAAVNVGVRPTVSAPAAAPVVEGHLLDFDEDLYGQRLELAFLRRLRDEERFASLDALRAQIGRDVEAVREYWATARR